MVSNKLEESLESMKLRMPKLDPQDSAAQYTGRGWKPVDAEAEQARLKELQNSLAERQALLEEPVE